MRRLQEEIVELVASKQAPRALIGVLEGIYAQDDEEAKRQLNKRRQAGEALPEEPAYQTYYGPWMRRQAYALTRMAEPRSLPRSRSRTCRYRPSTPVPSVRLGGRPLGRAIDARKEREG